MTYESPSHGGQTSVDRSNDLTDLAQDGELQAKKELARNAPSGKLTVCSRKSLFSYSFQSAISMAHFFYSYVSLPEGIPKGFRKKGKSL